MGVWVEMVRRGAGFEVVGVGAAVMEALEIAQKCAPDVISLDLCMPGGGIEAAACIALYCPSVRTMMLTASECEHDVASSLQAGARGYVLKGSSESEVVEAVHAIARGNFYFTPNFVARLLIEKSKRLENRRQRQSSVIPLAARSHSLRRYRQQYPQ